MWYWLCYDHFNECMFLVGQPEKSVAKLWGECNTKITDRFVYMYERTIYVDNNIMDTCLVKLPKSQNDHFWKN